MARKNQRPFVDLMDLAAMLPWWLSFLLAGVTYLILSNISLEPVQIAQGAAPDIPNLVIGTLLMTLFSLLKYVIPVGFVIGGLSAARDKLFIILDEAYLRLNVFVNSLLIFIFGDWFETERSIKHIG